MILIPEQVGAIRKRILDLRAVFFMNDSYYNDREIVDFGNIKNVYDDCNLTGDQYEMNVKQLREYEKLLLESKFLREIDTDKISIGTKFGVRFNGSDEVEYYTLTENLLGLNSNDGFISIQSILGQSLYEKKEKDNFLYEVNIDGERRVIDGEIVYIEKSYNSYVNYIRNRRLKDRMVKSERGKRDKNSINDNGLKEKFLTLSQTELLRNELEKLEMGLNKRRLFYNNFNAQAHRLFNIKKILIDNNIVDLPKDDTVGIGSHVSIVLFEDSGIKTRRVELIEHAVSDELTIDYVERISSLGINIFGLKNNDSFVYRTGNKICSGMVYDIDNSENAIRTTDPLVYQKSIRRKK